MHALVQRLANLRAGELNRHAWRWLGARSSSSQSDVIVVGTGVAGCAAALRAAHAGLRVTLLTSQADPTSCNSYWAQGGIIYKARAHPSRSERTRA